MPNSYWAFPSLVQLGEFGIGVELLELELELLRHRLVLELGIPLGFEHVTLRKIVRDLGSWMEKVVRLWVVHRNRISWKVLLVPVQEAQEVQEVQEV